jgi:hypothetical protein
MVIQFSNHKLQALSFSSLAGPPVEAEQLDFWGLSKVGHAFYGSFQHAALSLQVCVTVEPIPGGTCCLLSEHHIPCYRVFAKPSGS